MSGNSLSNVANGEKTRVLHHSESAKRFRNSTCGKTIVGGARIAFRLGPSDLCASVQVTTVSRGLLLGGLDRVSFRLFLKTKSAAEFSEQYARTRARIAPPSQLETHQRPFAVTLTTLMKMAYGRPEPSMSRWRAVLTAPAKMMTVRVHSRRGYWGERPLVTLWSSVISQIA